MCPVFSMTWSEIPDFFQMLPDLSNSLNFLDFPQDCLHGFRTESTYSLDCLPILLSISIFTFSFFHYLVLILCSRLSWLMRAFERSLKQHLVSYCMTFQDFSGRWEPKLQPFNRQNHRASITIQQKIVKAKDTLSFSCWQLRSAAANNISDSFNHGIEHSNCYTQQPNKVHIHTQPFNGLWSGTTRVGRYQKKHSPTHTHPDHRTSFIIFLHLQWSMASSLFILRAWQSSRTTSLQVLFGLPLALGPSTSYSIHFFTQSSSSFHSQIK